MAHTSRSVGTSMPARLAPRRWPLLVRRVPTLRSALASALSVKGAPAWQLAQLAAAKTALPACAGVVSEASALRSGLGAKASSEPR